MYTYKVMIHPNNKQETKIRRTLNKCIECNNIVYEYLDNILKTKQPFPKCGEVRKWFTLQKSVKDNETKEKRKNMTKKEMISNHLDILFYDVSNDALKQEIKDTYNSFVRFFKKISNYPVKKSKWHDSIRLTHRISNDGKEFYYLVNVGKETDFELIVTGVKNFIWYDIFNDKYEIIGGKLHFEDGGSYILYLTDKDQIPFKKLEPLYLQKQFEIVDDVENYLVMDFLKYSFDGINYSEKLHHMGVFNEMLEKRYKGDLYLKYEFSVKEIPEFCNLLIENTNIIEVFLNGQKLIKTGNSKVEKELFYYDCQKIIKKGLNEVVVKINYYQSENVYYALFGENVTETLKNCLAYDTDIEAIMLKGNFGVYGDFSNGKDDSILLGSNFYIGKQIKKVNELITQGFPFYSGIIKLKQTIEIDNPNKQLVIEKRFHLIDVKVNGRFVNRLMFTNKLDLHDYLQKGKNEIELELCISNRNLFGPFHTQEQENLNVGPYLFERLGTWKDGKSSILRESYSFVKSII